MRATGRGDRAAGTRRRRGVAAQGELVVGGMTMVVADAGMQVGKERDGSRGPAGVHGWWMTVVSPIMLTPLQDCRRRMLRMRRRMQWVMRGFGSLGRLGLQNGMRGG